MNARAIERFLARSLALLAAALAGCVAPAQGAGGSEGGRVAVELFDGASLAGWRVAELGGAAVDVEDGRIVLAQGTPLSGIVFDDPALALPHEDYELVATAARLAGSDFFLGLTFPVGDAHATVVLGGWGGSLCGLSCVDGEDASANATRSFRGFARGAEVTLRVAVTRDAVTAWADGELLFRQPRAGHIFAVRPEMAACRPLGLAAYQTRAGVSRVSLVLARSALELTR